MSSSVATPADHLTLESDLRRALQENEADLYVKTADDLTALWRATYRRQDFSEAQFAARFKGLNDCVLNTHLPP